MVGVGGAPIVEEWTAWFLVRERERELKREELIREATREQKRRAVVRLQRPQRQTPERAPRQRRAA